MSKDVSIILVSYNTCELTKNCLASIYEKTTGLDFDVWVVDNASKDNSAEMIKAEFPQVNLIESKENLGFGGGNNLAIEKSDAKYVLLLNTDTLLINNAVKIMFDFMEENANVGACGGNLYNKDEKHALSFGYLPTLKTKFVKTFQLKNFFPEEKLKIEEKGFNENDELKKVGYITGADVMMRKSVLDEVGTFDNEFFLYYEETELQHRISSFGTDIYILPEAKIYHLEGASTKKNREKRRYELLRGEYLYYKKTNAPEKINTVRFLCMASHLLRLISTPTMIFKLWRDIWTH